MSDDELIETALLTLPGESMTLAEIAGVASVSMRRASSALLRLEERGEVERVRHGWRARLTAPQEPARPVVDAEPEWKSRRRRRSDRPRARTIAAKRLTRDEVTAIATADVERPRTRGDCADGERPCPFVGCRHHLYADVSAAGGLKLNFPHLEVWEMKETCALDVADRGGVTLEEVGEILNLTRERIRQVEVKALLKLRRRAPSAGLAEDART